MAWPLCDHSVQVCNKDVGLTLGHTEYAKFEYHRGKEKTNRIGILPATILSRYKSKIKN